MLGMPMEIRNLLSELASKVSMGLGLRRLGSQG
jgi:hypothetical protein